MAKIIGTLKEKPQAKRATKPKLSRTPQISKTPYRGGAKASTMPKKGNEKPKVSKVKYI